MRPRGWNRATLPTPRPRELSREKPGREESNPHPQDQNLLSYAVRRRPVAGQGERVRTSDSRSPEPALYQTELHPVELRVGGSPDEVRTRNFRLERATA